MEKNQDILGRILELSLLFDFYGSLLSEHKSKVFEDYVLNDYSLGEMSSLYGISRQGIHDLVKRCIRELEAYEKKLGLVLRFQSIKEKLLTIDRDAEFIKATHKFELIDSIQQTVCEIMDEL